MHPFCGSRITLNISIFILVCTAASKLKSDWEAGPCFGECRLSINSSTASGVLRISGTDAAVSDITPSAGWSIIECDPDAADQDIRLVCQHPSRGCAHVYRNGAEGTLVRLPENCGPKPFAIVTREWDHDNQSVPERFELARRGDAPPPVVKGMALTTSFANIESTRHGIVNLFLVGTSLPDVDDATMGLPEDIGNGSLRDWVNGSLHAFAQVHADLSLSVGTFNKSGTGATTVSFDKNISLYKTNMSCPQQGKRPAFMGELFVDVEPSVNGSVSYAVSAVGSIIPPRLVEFGFFVGLDAAVASTLTIGASLTGSISSGAIPLFSIGLPELSFPGILSIGPTISISAEATAFIDTYLNLTAGLTYDIQGMQVALMSGSHSQTGQVHLGKMGDMRLSASPSLAFGINAFDGTMQTTASLDFDAETSLDLSLSGVLGLAPSTAQCHRHIRLSFEGCANVSSGFSVNARADADFLDMFKKGKSVQLYKEDYDLYSVRVPDMPVSVLC
ncbi:hypothetical protein GY45DRAFT_1370196 [Cubamyces sp. BRFM 1775]|nr:hypothetical protein GY45DRAFT_1370196 [Cubamyces sp. BRFM 1775]